MRLHDIRYSFESSLLPKWFYSGDLEFVTMLTKNPKFIYHYFHNISKINEYEDSYIKEEFIVNTYKVEDLNFTELLMPTPEVSPLAYSIYMVYGDNFVKPMYFTLEKTVEGKQIGMWFDGIHFEYELIEEQSVQQTILDIYNNNYKKELED